jgi:acetyl-CoA carboxylase carboxyl transferase subunit alpha
MLENAIYSVISPEGCAAILWKDSTKSIRAADSLRLTAKDLYQLKIVDEVVEEPLGGAHKSFDEAATFLEKSLARQLEHSMGLNSVERLARRYRRIRSLGF